MKMKIILLELVGAIVAIALSSCTTTQQRTAYNTIFTVEQTATVAVDGYYTLVIKGTLNTNSVPIVSKSYNNIQAAGKTAADAAQAGTNALAPASLIIEVTDLGHLITTVEQTDRN
jgi:hypothetical protein